MSETTNPSQYTNGHHDDGGRAMINPPLGSQTSILEMTVAFFDGISWDYSRHANKPILSMRHQGKKGAWRCVAQARESETQHQFLFYSVLDSFTPPDKRPAMAEFLTRANYGMIIGNFEMDFSDGEVRYKTSIDVSANIEHLTDAQLRSVVFTNVLMMDKYFPGLMSVMYLDRPPAELIAEIEK